MQAKLVKLLVWLEKGPVCERVFSLLGLTLSLWILGFLISWVIRFLDFWIIIFLKSWILKFLDFWIQEILESLRQAGAKKTSKNPQ